MTITNIPVSDLSIHPALSRMARWEQDDPRFLSLVDDIRDRGIDVPLIIDPENRVVDGRHRFLAAKRLQLTTVPAQTVQADQVASIMLSTILQRRHYGPGQRAYITYPFFEEAHNEAVVRRTAGLRCGTKTGSSIPRTIADFATELGFSRELFKQAARVHQIFADDPSYAAEMESRILDEHSPVGLGAVIAGYAGKNSTAGKPKTVREARQLELFTQTITDEITRWDAWSSADDATRAAHWRHIRKQAAELPADQLAAIADYHRDLAKTFTAAAKERA